MSFFKNKLNKESKLRISSVFLKKIAYHTLRNKTKLYFLEIMLACNDFKIVSKRNLKLNLSIFLSVTVHECTYTFQFSSSWYADSTNAEHDLKTNVFLEFKFSKTLLLTVIPHQRGRGGVTYFAMVKFARVRFKTSPIRSMTH